MSRGFMRQRGSSWELRVYGGTDPLTGRERRIYRTVRGDRATAERELTKLQAEVDAGGHAGPDATFAHLLDEWSKLKRRRWSPKTALETQGYIDRWLAPPPTSNRHEWALGRRRLRELTPRLLDAYNARLLEELAPATVRRIHGVTRAALGQAVRWDWLVRNPAERCEEIEGRSPEVRPPSVDDIAAVLAHLDDEPDVALFVRLAAVTGRRRGELCALRWSDVDWKRGSLLVARTLVDSERDGWVERPISKNVRRFPPIALDSATLAALRAHHDEQEVTLGALGCWVPDGWVFTRTKGGGLHPWSPDGASRRIARVREAAGVEGLRLHSLRHWAATAMLDGGIATPTAAGRLGHSGGGRITHDVYAHQMPATDLAAADLLAGLLDAHPEGR